MRGVDCDDSPSLAVPEYGPAVTVRGSFPASDLGIKTYVGNVSGSYFRDAAQYHSTLQTKIVLNRIVRKWSPLSNVSMRSFKVIEARNPKLVWPKEP